MFGWKKKFELRHAPGKPLHFFFVMEGKQMNEKC
jgi:hypothetical protein